MKKVIILWATPHIKNPSFLNADDLYSQVGHNNGNLAFVEGAKLLFENETVFAPWHTKPSALKELGDIIYMPCANQLGSHTDLGTIAETLEAAQIPVVAVGLGAQTRDTSSEIKLTPGTEKWVRTMASLSAGKNNILTRGAFTSSFLDSLKIGSHLPSACPSLFISPNLELHSVLAERSTLIPRSVAVCAGHQSWAEIKHIERQLASIVSDAVFPGSYVVQSMKDMIKISLGGDEIRTIDKEILDKIISFVRPEMSHLEFIQWCSSYAYSFYDIASWMFHLKRHDFVIGARYHGTALGIQAGVPSLCITIDSRTNELCQSSRIPFIKYDEITRISRADMRDLFLKKFDANAFLRNRTSKATQYTNFLRSNGLVPSQHLIHISKNNALGGNAPSDSRIASDK